MPEFVLIRLPTSYDVTGNWPHWWLDDPPLDAASLFALLCGLYAAAGLRFGWLAHNLFGASKVRSRIARALPLCAVFGLQLAMNIDWVSDLMRLAAPRGVSRMVLGHLAPKSHFLMADVTLLAIGLVTVAALTTLERRRTRARSFQMST